jgi:molybdenum cofactor cytidylyltransferase
LSVPEGATAPEGILLAAGRSSRAGVFKMELELAGKPLLLWSLETMAAVCERVIVVAGFAPEKILRLVNNRPGVEVTVNENFAAGMLTSIQAGIRLVRAPRFSFPVTYPWSMPGSIASCWRCRRRSLFRFAAAAAATRSLLTAV